MATVETKCRECYQEQVALWRNIEMNEELKEHASSYISPPKFWHPSILKALEAWGQEDLIMQLNDFEYQTIEAAYHCGWGWPELMTKLRAGGSEASELTVQHTLDAIDADITTAGEKYGL